MTHLSGKDLDIAVGLANGWTIRPDEFNSGRWILQDGSQGMLVDVYRPSKIWDHCGPLLEKAKMDLLWWGRHGDPHPWEAQPNSSSSHYIDQYPGEACGGSTPQEAICRAYLDMRNRK